MKTSSSTARWGLTKMLAKYLVAGLGTLAAASAYATPTLQLNIKGGTYDNGSQTIILNTGATVFYVNAYLKVDRLNAIADDYALSIALVPKTGPTADNTLGSFTIDSTPVSVTGGMVYGTPPVETITTQSSDSGDLATHGIYDTFFYEKFFSFIGTQITAEVNTAETSGPGYDPIANPVTDPDKTLYYVQFVLDAGLLTQPALPSSLSLHFDLYNRAICTDKKGKCAVVGDVDQSQFAPFSHDAQWLPNGITPEPGPAPAPAPLALIGLGAALLGLTRRRFSR